MKNLNFSNCNPFPSKPSAAKDTKYYIIYTHRIIVNNTEPLKITLKIGNTAPLREKALQASSPSDKEHINSSYPQVFGSFEGKTGFFFNILAIQFLNVRIQKFL